MVRDEEAEAIGPFQFAILVLSMVLLLGIAAEWVLEVPREVERLIFYIDNSVCVVFFVDFVTRLRAAPSKLAFMKWGWLDLLASVPAVEALRWGRAFRIVRVVRIMMAVRSLRRLLRILFASRRRAGAASLFVITFLVVSFGSLDVLLAETTPEANIRTAEDALWWCMTTVTTVGYGDRYPVTDAGRAVATFVMIAGIGLFGTLSGVAASFFLGDAEEKHTAATGEAQAAILARLDALQRELAEVRSTRSDDLRNSAAGGSSPAP